MRGGRVVNFTGGDNNGPIRNVVQHMKIMGADLLTSIAKSSKLRTLSLEWVEIMNGVNSIDLESAHIEHLLLVWQGHDGEGMMIHACQSLGTLQITWHDEAQKTSDSWQTWSNGMCREVTPITKARTLVSTKNEQQTLFTILPRLKGLKKLRVEGNLLPFTGANEVNELTSQIDNISDLKVNVFGSDRVTMCRLLSVAKQLENLEVNFCDNVNESETLLNSLADMLNFNPPLRSIYVTGDDPFSSVIDHNHFRTLKAMLSCPGYNQTST
ncbi:hypothetical protein EV359DRAFT_69241, partial [Lentinula novae-zelandiae]